MSDKAAIQAVCEKIAYLAGVYTDKPRYGGFCRSMGMHIAGCAASFRDSQVANQYGKRAAYNGVSLKRISEAAKKLADAVEKRPDEVNAALRWEFFEWRVTNKAIPLNVDRTQYDEFIKSIAVIATITKKAAQPHPAQPWRFKEPKGKGRPRGAQNIWANALVYYLLYWTRAYGGELKLTAESGGGTLIKALELCRTVLPEGFKILKPKALQLLKTHFTRSEEFDELERRYPKEKAKKSNKPPTLERK